MTAFDIETHATNPKTKTRRQPINAVKRRHPIQISVFCLFDCKGQQNEMCLIHCLLIVCFGWEGNVFFVFWLDGCFGFSCFCFVWFRFGCLVLVGCFVFVGWLVVLCERNRPQPMALCCTQSGVPVLSLALRHMLSVQSLPVQSCVQ